MSTATLPAEPSSPIAIPDFRRFWLARFIAVGATLSMVVLIGYQAYDIARSDYGYSRSEGAFLLGLLGLAQFIPLLLLTPVAGWTADRFDRRVVAACANMSDCTIAGVLAYATWADTLTLPLLFTLAALHGAARVFVGPSMGAIAPNIVPPCLLPRAIAMSSPPSILKNPSGVRSPVRNWRSRGSTSLVINCALLASVRATSTVGTS